LVKMKEEVLMEEEDCFEYWAEDTYHAQQIKFFNESGSKFQLANFEKFR